MAEESNAADRRSRTYRWFGLAVALLLLGMLALTGRLTEAIKWGLVLVVLAGICHAYFHLVHRRNQNPDWARYVMAGLDVLFITAWLYIASMDHGIAYFTRSPVLLIYPIVIFAVATRLDGKLIIATTVWSVICLNAVYLALLWPEGFSSTAARDVNFGLISEFYRSLYILVFGAVLLLFPRTVFKLLRREGQLFADKAALDQEYRDLVERAQSLIMKLDGDGRITFFNQHAQQVLGYPEGEALGATPWRLLAPDRQAAETQEAAIEEAIREGREDKTAWCHEAELRRKDGGLVWVAWSHRLVYDENGKLAEVLCVGNDITARHNAELALLNSKADLERLVAERTAELESANTDLRDEVARRAQVEAELRGALSQVKHLSGLLPICAQCKKIRDDQGYWNNVEEYIREHSEARFSHSLCPSCMHKLYPEIAEDVLSKLGKDDY